MSYTETLRPRADGSYTGFTPVPSSPPTHWDKVLTAGDDKNNTWDNAYFGWDSYWLNDPTLSGTITSIVLHISVGSVLPPLARKVFIVTYNTVYTQDLGTSGVSYEWTTNPYTGDAWTVAELTYAGYGSFEAGVQLLYSNLGHSWIDYLYVVVNYGPRVYPTDPIIRVNNIIHRYNRKNQVYTMECSLGEVTSDFGLPEWSDVPKKAIPDPEPLTPEEPEKETVVEGARVVDPSEFPKVVEPDVPDSSDKVTRRQSTTEKVTSSYSTTLYVKDTKKEEPSLWSKITPWKEEEGETFGSAIKQLANQGVLGIVGTWVSKLFK